MTDASEIRASIGSDVIAGVGGLVEAAVCEWANCQEASVDESGGIWIENPCTGHWLSDEKVVEFFNWNKAQ